MNCPSKTDPIVPDGHNQNPNDLSADLTTRSDLGRVANARKQREHTLSDPAQTPDAERIAHTDTIEPHEKTTDEPRGSDGANEKDPANASTATASHAADPSPRQPFYHRYAHHLFKILRTYAKFIGPGFMISVAYIDPGNYATDVAAGQSYRFKLLFMILLSNIFAIFLQSLCITLGTVTGLNLSEMTRKHCPRWLNYISWVFGESAIIATDLAEVIGTAIALSMLSDGRIPLVAGCAISIVDVLFILIFYRQDGASLTARRAFECFVALLVLGVVICFCIQLSFIRDVTPGEVFRGYLPSSALVESTGLYQACGILGATVMPHSLYLGSGLVQERLKDFDREHHHLPSPTANNYDDGDDDDSNSILRAKYQPSLHAIRSCRWYSIAECGISLFTFALFVNSSILIVAGASLYVGRDASDASLFKIYSLLSSSLAPAAGKLFAVALLLSGTSAGIVCTIAGQMVSEGQLNLRMKPWKRRLLTRSISIVPAIVVAAALGGPGVDKALVGSQVALSVILPFVSAPLVWFTCRSKYMLVEDTTSGADGSGLCATADAEGWPRLVNLRVHPVTAFFAVVIWGVIVVMNVALLVLVGMGKA